MAALATNAKNYVESQAMSLVITSSRGYGISRGLSYPPNSTTSQTVYGLVASRAYGKSIGIKLGAAIPSTGTDSGSGSSSIKFYWR